MNNLAVPTLLLIAGCGTSPTNTTADMTVSANDLTMATAADRTGVQSDRTPIEYDLTGVEVDLVPGVQPDLLRPPGDMRASNIMTFFVTSVGNGANGGNYGGRSGADAHCQSLAASAGAGGRTWHAYLSTSNGDARDLIGTGPWHNFDGNLVAANVASLHASPPSFTLIMDEHGVLIPSNDHDVLTGSDNDGTKLGDTCQDWTSSSPNDYNQVGHGNWDNMAPNIVVGVRSWNSAHNIACDQASMASTGGSGRLYCFAIN